MNRCYLALSTRGYMHKPLIQPVLRDEALLADIAAANRDDA